MDNEYKQIYATQGNQDPAGCFCLWPVEKTATDDFRRKAGAKTIDDQLKWIADLNKNEPKCKAAVCPQAAKPAVKGVLPGVVW
jgi:hypothetical protein